MLRPKGSLVIDIGGSLEARNACEVVYHFGAARHAVPRVWFLSMSGALLVEPC